MVAVGPARVNKKRLARLPSCLSVVGGAIPRGLLMEFLAYD